MSENDKLNQNDSNKDNDESNHLTEINKSNPDEVSNGNNNDTTITGNEDIDELLNELPESKKKVIRSMSMLQMSSSNHIVNPIADKINERHIDKFLEASKQNMELEYKEKGRNKVFVGVIVFFTMIFIVTIIVLLKNNPDVMEKIIGTLIGLVAGAIGGYGYGKNKNNDD